MPKTEIGLQKSPAKSPVKRGRMKTPTLPPTTRGSRSQSKARRPSTPENSKSVRTDTSSFHLLSTDICSDDLVKTPVPANRLPRNYWLANSEKLSPPWISCADDGL
ncbi:hypothetical protein E4T39_01999 [Aureobasidium subglaciale]|nr:hypothetical protein E4T39_01999 [Aureobasidium subglaciale]